MIGPQMGGDLAMRYRAVIIALFLPICAANAAPSGSHLQIGDTYEITRHKESSNETSDGSSSGSSSDRDTLTEKVIGVRTDGLELEYDFPKISSAEERASAWQFPARVFKLTDGSLHLLNGPELESRVNAWLKNGGLKRSSCGQLIFTWNVFRIECDPQSAIKIIEGFSVQPDDLRSGALYRDAAALKGVPLIYHSNGAEGGAFVAEMMVDTNVVRRSRAETDIVVAQMSGKNLTLDAALSAHASESISGTITTTFDTDAAGNARKRIDVEKVITTHKTGKVETETTTTVTERRLIGRRAS